MGRGPQGMRLSTTVALVGAVCVAVILPSCLSYEAFLEKRAQKYCDELERCNPETPCELASGVDTGFADEENCAYDAGAARDCLKGTWTCDERFPGFEYPIPAQACFSVCGGL